MRHGEPRDPAWSLSTLHSPLKPMSPLSSNPASVRAGVPPRPAPGPLRGPRLHAGLRGVTGAARDHTACEWRSQDGTVTCCVQRLTATGPPAPHTSPKEAGSGAGGAASGDGVPWGRLIPARPVGGVRKPSSSLVWRVGGARTTLQGSLGPHPDSKPNSSGFEPMPCPLHQLLRTGWGLLCLAHVPQFTPSWMAGGRLTSIVSP